jgi:hypothetical protein
MKVLEKNLEQQLELIQEVEPVVIHKKLHQCKGCKKHVTKLYQQDLCKSCLSLAFKRLIKIIDSVRKVESPNKINLEIQESTNLPDLISLEESKP